MSRDLELTLLVLLAEKVGITLQEVEDRKVEIIGKLFSDCLPKETNIEEIMVQDFKPRDRSELFFVRGVKRIRK